MKRLLLLPFELVVVLLLAVVLPAVWLMGVCQGFVDGLHGRSAPPRRRSPGVVLPFALSDELAQRVLDHHEVQLRQGRTPWH